MTPIQNLHYAIGELACALASVDGKVQKEEAKKFHAMMAAELRCKHYDFDIADIIFTIMSLDRLDIETTYNWAMKEIRMNGHYLSPELKETFIRLLEKVAKAYPPVTNEEQSIIDRFKADIATVKGDPVYYGKQHV